MNHTTRRMLATFLYTLASSSCQAQATSSGAATVAAPASGTNILVYSCDLRTQFNQCRQFAIDPQQAAVRVSEVEESCQSLGGRLAPLACPGAEVIARCEKVKFRRDFYYDNSYYPGEPSSWTPATLEYACTHLPGKYRAASSPAPGETPQH